MPPPSEVQVPRRDETVTPTAEVREDHADSTSHRCERSLTLRPSGRTSPHLCELTGPQERHRGLCSGPPGAVPQLDTPDGKGRDLSFQNSSPHQLPPPHGEQSTSPVLTIAPHSIGPQPLQLAPWAWAQGCFSQASAQPGPLYHGVCSCKRARSTARTPAQRGRASSDPA